MKQNKSCSLKSELVLCAWVVHIGQFIFQMYCNYKLVLYILYTILINSPSALLKDNQKKKCNCSLKIKNVYLRRGLYNTFKRRKKNGKTKCKIKLPFQKHFLISDSIAALSCFLKERIWSGNSAWVSVATTAQNWLVSMDACLNNERSKLIRYRNLCIMNWENSTNYQNL